jgi:thymidylate synthase
MSGGVYFTPRSFSAVFEKVMSQGSVVESVRGNTMEVLNMSLRLPNPLDRYVTEKWRKTNLPFAIAEFLSLMLGKDSLGIFLKFIPSFGEYSSNRETVDGAYGPRIRPIDDGSQLSVVQRMLREDPLSRRAVVAIYSSADILSGAGGLNTPCTLTLQFLIRNNRLCMIVNMRSNDLIWGFTNDLIVFTMIHEFMARSLCIEPGTYYHNAGSLHIYEKHWKMLSKGGDDMTRCKIMTRPMPLTTYDELKKVYSIYENIDDNTDLDMGDLRIYWKDLIYAARAFYLRETNPAKSREVYWKIADHVVSRVMLPWIPGLSY